MAEDSPLREAKPSMAEIFQRDPLQLTRQDRDAIVAVLRQRRVEFQREEVASKNKPKRTRAPDGLSLDDLLK